MADQETTPHAGDMLFEEFLEQVKQVLQHLFDFAYLQQHPLARMYDGSDDLSAKTAGRQLRYEVIKAIEALEPQPDAHFRAPTARLYNILHLCYVENLNIQAAADELGLSERQAYRDLRRGQESVAAILWDNRLPSTPAVLTDDFSLESEVARLKLHFSPVDVAEIYRQGQRAVEKLAERRNTTIIASETLPSMILSTDGALAHQVIVSLLSQAVQQAESDVLHVTVTSEATHVLLILRYTPEDEGEAARAFSGVQKLAQRLRWKLTHEHTATGWQVTLRMASEGATLLVIDDNQGWIELLSRFLEGYNVLVMTAAQNGDIVQQVEDLQPTLIMLDVMMPGRDGWELLQRLRVQPTTAHIPIIVCTVFDDPQLAYSLGASAFVSKPASREKILDVLRQATII